MCKSNCMSKFHELRVKSIQKETTDAVSISFEVPEELKEEFRYVAGQYLTLEKEIAGRKFRRSYSICSSPHSEELKVAVKQVADGSFSAWVNNKLKEGDFLNVFLPEGRFVYQPLEEDQDKTYVGFAVGSGITPVMAILQSVLCSEENSKFVLVYGNKSPEHTIFYKELLELKKQYPDRFYLELVFSQSKEKDAFFGRIEPGTVDFIFRNKFKDANFADVFICGPEPLLEMVTERLIQNSIDQEKIRFELFVKENNNAMEVEDTGQKTRITVILDEEEVTFDMDRDKRVLNAVIGEGMDPPYSCQGGICSSCLAMVVEGEVKMANNQILTDEEIEEGLVLTCQAHPLSPTLTIDYDEI